MANDPDPPHHNGDDLTPGRKLTLASAGASAALIIFFAGPLLIEATGDPCGAVAFEVMRTRNEVLVDLTTSPLAPLAMLAVNATLPGMVRTRVAQVLPGMPAGLGCPLTYWAVMVNPNFLAEHKS